MDQPSAPVEIAKDGILALLQVVARYNPNTGRFIDLTPGRTLFACLVSAAASTYMSQLQIFTVAASVAELARMRHTRRVVTRVYPGVSTSVTRHRRVHNGAIDCLLEPEEDQTVYLCTKSMSRDRFTTVMEILATSRTWAMLIVADDGPGPEDHLPVRLVHTGYARPFDNAHPPVLLRFWVRDASPSSNFDALWWGEPVQPPAPATYELPDHAAARALHDFAYDAPALPVAFLGPDARPPSPPDWEPEPYNHGLPEIEI